LFYQLHHCANGRSDGGVEALLIAVFGPEKTLVYILEELFIIFLLGLGFCATLVVKMVLDVID
jgi:hypothetical protein